MAKSTIKTSPAYVNDALLKVALLGTRHQPFDVTALSASLQDTATQILARDEPASALFALLNLSSTLERASNEGLVEVSSKIVPVAPPQVVGERYLPAEVMTKLLDPEISTVEWTAILARFRGTGLKVPSHCSQAFLRNFKRLRSKLHPLYRDFPIEFLGIRARFVEQFTSDEDLVLEPRSWDDLGVSERKAKVAELLVQHAYDAVLDLLEGSFMGLAQDLRLDMLQLWEAHWFEFLCYGYRSAWFDAEDKSQNTPFGAAALEQAFVEALRKVYGAQVERAVVNNEPVGLSDDSAQLEVLLQTGTAVKLAITAQASISVQSDGVQPLGVVSSVVQRVEHWLLRVLRSESSLANKVVAAKLLRMLPGGRFEEQMIEFVRKVFSFRRGEVPVLKRELLRAHREIASSLVTFFPELSEERDYSAKSRMTKVSDTDREYLACLTLLLPPELWFEFFDLKRTGNDLYDASNLFAYFYELYPGWNKIDRYSSEQGEFVQYFLLRTQFELGPDYFANFCRKCGRRYVWYETYLSFIENLSYNERESCPLVSGPADVIFDFSSWNDSLDILLNSAHKSFSEPFVHWGPKLSEFYFGQLVDQFVVGSRCTTLELMPQAPALRALALSLDPKVRVQAINRIKQNINACNAEIARLKQPTAFNEIYRDDALRYEHMNRYNLQMLLRYFDWADELNELCARARSAA